MKKIAITLEMKLMSLIQNGRLMPEFMRCGNLLPTQALVFFAYGFFGLKKIQN